MKYTKLEATLKERLVFLFTGLLCNKLYEKWKCVLEPNNTNKAVLIESQSTPLQEEKSNINNIEEETIDNIPFFDLDNSETKSNL
jgi:hypothetical protein